MMYVCMWYHASVLPCGDGTGCMAAWLWVSHVALCSIGFVRSEHAMVKIEVCADAVLLWSHQNF